MQITNQNVSLIRAEFIRVTCGPNRDVSRAYRRLFERVMPYGFMDLIIGAPNGVLTRTRRDQLKAWANEFIKTFGEDWVHFDKRGDLEVVKLEHSQFRIRLYPFPADHEPTLREYKIAADTIENLLGFFPSGDWDGVILGYAEVLKRRREIEKRNARLNEWQHSREMSLSKEAHL